jgi:hypothetical protein
MATMKLCGVYVAVTVFNRCMCPAQQVECVASKAARHATTSANTSVDKPENPRFDGLKSTRTYPSMIIAHLFRLSWRTAVARAKNRLPPFTLAVSGLFCASQAKRALATAAAIYTIRLKWSSLSINRACLCFENASWIMPHANLSHVLAPSEYHVMPFSHSHAAQARAKALGARQDSAACPRYASCRLRRGSSAAERREEVGRFLAHRRPLHLINTVINIEITIKHSSPASFSRLSLALYPLSPRRACKPPTARQLCACLLGL